MTEETKTAVSQVMATPTVAPVTAGVAAIAAVAVLSWLVTTVFAGAGIVVNVPDDIQGYASTLLGLYFWHKMPTAWESK